MGKLKSQSFYIWRLRLLAAVIADCIKYIFVKYASFFFLLPWFTCFWNFPMFLTPIFIYDVKKMNRVSLMLFFVDILILRRILGLLYQVVPKIWSRRCYEMMLKNGYQQLKYSVSLILLVYQKWFVLSKSGLYFFLIMLALREILALFAHLESFRSCRVLHYD